MTGDGKAGPRPPAAMRVARGPEEAGFDPRSVVTIGSFDGMHLGHRAILAEVLRRTTANGGGRSVVVTFDPHPRSVVGKGPVSLLTTLEERIELLDEAGVDLTLVVKFTPEFSRLSAAEFYGRYLLRGTGVREVVVGDDHMFGHDREAGIEALHAMGRDSGFAVTVVGPVALEGKRVGSSAIRGLLAVGDVEGAARFLGRPYALDATVVPGEGRGRSIGFPTANLDPVSAEKVVPGDGVYLVSASVGGDSEGGLGMRHGMANIGRRPTFGEGGPRTIEAHLFGEDRDLYGRPMRLSFLRRIRGERKFSGAAELAAQLLRDRDDCLRLVAAAG